jgi:hypothetical protein
MVMDPFDREMREDAETPHTAPNWARYTTALVSAWLVVSAFAWPHSVVLGQVTWITGALMFATAVAAMAFPVFRWAHTALAAWLFLATVWLPNVSAATVWNNVLVAGVVFTLALFPSGKPHRLRHGMQRSPGEPVTGKGASPSGTRWAGGGPVA